MKEIPQLGYKKIKKDGKEVRVLTHRQQSVISQVNNGASLKNAILSAGYSPKGLQTLETRFKRYLDSHPRMVKKSGQVRAMIMDKALEGETAYIAAAERVSSRVQDSVAPLVHRQETVNINADISVFDLSIYTNNDSPSD